MLLVNMLMATIAKKSGGELLITPEDQMGVTPADLHTERTAEGLKIIYRPNKERLEKEIEEYEEKIRAHHEALKQYQSEQNNGGDSAVNPTTES